MVTSFLFIHITDVKSHLILALLTVHFNVLQLKIIISDLIHEITAIVSQTDAHVWRGQKWWRRRGRRW
jgi:methionyl-tRNA formyltransferase